MMSDWMMNDEDSRTEDGSFELIDSSFIIRHSLSDSQSLITPPTHALLPPSSPVLALGLPTLGVVAIPVLIHLINMMRHRRVEWAAMEFLLVSQKKNRTWVMLKQLLLLLLRMAAVAAVVLMVAQPVLRSQWGNLLGGTRTHHIVLLDDSFSMSDRWADTDAFSRGQAGRRSGSAPRRPAKSQPQTFTLLRFSRVGRSGAGRRARPAETAGRRRFRRQAGRLAGQDQGHADRRRPDCRRCRPSAQLLGARTTASGASSTWFPTSAPGNGTTRRDLRKELLRLDEAGAEIHLVNCVDRARPNLAIVSLAPAEGIRAAGVPWFMEVAVQNFGAAPARNVSVHLGRGRARAAGGHAAGDPARQDGQGAVPGAFSQRRPARDHRSAGKRRGGGRQLPLLRGRLAAGRAGAAGRRRRRGPRRPLLELGAVARRRRCAPAFGRRSRRPAT